MLKSYIMALFLKVFIFLKTKNKMQTEINNNKHLKNRQNKLLSATVVILSSVFIWQLFVHGTGTEESKHTENFNQDYNVYSLTLPEKMNFAGEEVPLYEPEVRERLDRELLVNTYWQSQTLLFFKRTAQWFPVIEPILEKYNIPNDFKYLPIIESGLMQVVSPSGATGFWQLMESAGKENGLIINNEVDERYNVERSTEAACLYLLRAYENFGNWTLALASYNMGISGVKRAQERQNALPYYDLLLNSETSRFVFRLLAIKEIMENPEKYGFNLENAHLYEPRQTEKVKVNSSVSNWLDFCNEHEITYKTLRYYNPWIRSYSLNNNQKKTFYVQIPIEKFRDTVSYDFKVLPELVKELIADEEKNENTEDVNVVKIYHVVKQNENLTVIARQYEVTPHNIKEWNNMSNDRINPGQKLKIIKQ